MQTSVRLFLRTVLWIVGLSFLSRDGVKLKKQTNKKMSILSESSFERAKHCKMNIEFDLFRVGVISYGGRQGPNTAAGMETMQI